MSSESNGVDRRLLRLVDELRQAFDARKTFFACLYQHETQVESWLKAELLHHLNGATNIRALEREKRVSVGEKKKVDLYWEDSSNESSTPIWLELKHWHIGYQRGQLWNTKSYFVSKESWGIRPDVRKLLAISGGHKYVFVLATANPTNAEWRHGFSQLQALEQDANCTDLTCCDDFPREFFLGLVRVDRKSHA